MKLRDLLNEGFTGQSNLDTLTPKIQQMVDKLVKDFPNFNINLTDNYRWLRRDDLRGTYTLSYSSKDFSGTDDNNVIKKLKHQVAKIQKFAAGEAKLK